MRALAGMLAALSLLVAAGCGGGDSAAPPATEPTTTESVAPPPPPPPSPPASPPAPPAPASTGPLFAKADLAALALAEADVPRNMNLTKEESGPRTLEEVGFVVPSQVREIERFGFEAVYDVIFDATDEDLRLASRLWLFETRPGASRFLKKTKNDSVSYLTEDVSSGVGQESWAARGSLSGSEVISHGFRVGNLVVVVSLSTQQGRVDTATALGAVRAAFARTQA